MHWTTMYGDKFFIRPYCDTLGTDWNFCNVPHLHLTSFWNIFSNFYTTEIGVLGQFDGDYAAICCVKVVLTHGAISC